MTVGAQVLLIDDEQAVRIGLEHCLVNEAKQVVVATEAREALEKFERGNYQVVISNARLKNGEDGLSLVSQMLLRRPDTTAIVMTPEGAMDRVVEAMQRGAFDVITKPVDVNLIRQQLRKAFERQRLIAENRKLKDRLAEAGQNLNVICSCPAMLNVLHQMRHVANTAANVLICGESGTGKKLVARSLHDLSIDRYGAFILLNTPSLPDSFFEEETSGKLRDQSQHKIQGTSCFEQAYGGTLFLEEVTAMSKPVQGNLLKAIETGKFSKPGAEIEQELRTRIVSSTSLSQIGTADGIRWDLLQMLSTVTIKLPPLRERGGDIPILLEHYLKYFGTRQKQAVKRFSTEAMKVLVAAPWPGNIRQLKNLTERLVVTVRAETIQVSDLPNEITSKSPGPNAVVNSLADATEIAERQAILTALLSRNYHREKTAKALGISLRTLHYKMSRYGIH